MSTGTRCLLGVVMLAMATGTLGAEELHGAMRQTFTHTTDDEEIGTSTWLQDYRVEFRNEITQRLSWQARLLARLNGFDRSGADSTDSAVTEPFLQVVYRSDTWEASGGWRLTRLSPKGSASTLEEQERENLFGNFSWTRAELPVVNWSVYRTTLDRDDIPTSTEDRSLLTFGYAKGPGNLGLGIENLWFTDEVTRFERNAVNITGNGSLTQSFVDGRLTFYAQALTASGAIEERSPGSQLVDVLRIPRAGLFAIDDTPLDGALTDTPALIDRDLVTPAADLSDDFRNFGVDFGFDRTVDTAYVTLERRLQPGNAQDYTWAVFTSADGDLWSLRSVPGVVPFDDLLQRFEIVFPSTTTRYVKVVATRVSRTEPPIAATEVQFTGKETRTGEQDTNTQTRSGNLVLTWVATDTVRLSLATFGTRIAADQGEDEEVVADRDFGSTVTGILNPGITRTTVRLQQIRRSSDLIRSEIDRLASVTVGVNPLERLEVSFNGTARRNRSPSALLIGSEAFSVRTAARFSEALEASIDLGWIDVRDEEFLRDTERHYALLSLLTTFRPGLTMANSWRVERLAIDDMRAVGGGMVNRTDADLRTLLAWRPTRVFGTEVELIYQDIGFNEGFSHLVGLDWLPFPGGAVQVQATFEQDRTSLVGDARDTTRLSARWTINPLTLLELRYSTTRIANGAGATSTRDSVSAFLEYRF